MPRARRVCSQPGCPALTNGGRCDQHRREADQRRGGARARGYDTEHERFRAAVLARDPACRYPDGCTQPATVADHWPHSRRELVALGLDPNDPRHGRGLCASHHGRETATHQPGGFLTRHTA